jgi:hypothetical protein
VQTQFQDLPSAELDDTFQVAADALRSLPAADDFPPLAPPAGMGNSCGYLGSGGSCVCLFALINQVSLNAL